MTSTHARAIVLAIAGLMAQNAGSYVAWGEMWAWQQALTLLALALIIVALLITYPC